MDEIRNLFDEFVKKQNNKMSKLQSTVDEIRTQNNTITASIQLLSDKYDDIQKELEKIKTERKEHLACIKTLENKVENMEKNSCAAKIEIRNIPTSQRETKSDLCELTKKLGSVLDLKIDTNDIKDVYRGFAKPDTPKPILIEFTSVLLKDKILNSLKSFNKKDRKLNTSLMQIEGPPKPIYISEALTSKGKRLYYLAREFAKTYNFSFCWSSYGKIYLRKKEGTQHVRIDEEGDFAKLKENTI
ncbi:unnamed protein product [Plutella xylostella]|uniref:(diamondback moth) hypothetical protein n=1 Tax=Plutella xylostella TaxID=51655 RepID=A0A8S4FHV2_PLUXY|nr:unnamed protein product [Plutella xylostella]